MRPPRNRLRDLGIVLAGVAIGTLAVLFVVRGGIGSEADAAPLDLQADSNGQVADAGRDGADAQPDGGAKAGRPAAAVKGFLAAEIDGRFADSFGFLSAADRDSFGSAADWIAVHADLLPPITGYTVDEIEVDRDRAEVSGTVAFTPGLDEVLGLTAPTADATWVVVRDAREAWRIDLESTQLTPVHAEDDSGARDAADRWVRTRQRCGTQGEWDGGLLGSPALAGQLCETDGALEVGAVTELADVDAAPFNATFGPDVTSWARVVDVRGATPLRVVLAPVGDRWLVIGVLRGTT